VISILSIFGRAVPARTIQLEYREHNHDGSYYGWCERAAEQAELVRLLEQVIHGHFMPNAWALPEPITWYERTFFPKTGRARLQSAGA
jgi:hypothetical protein